jgi:hypothetical protein
MEARINCGVGRGLPAFLDCLFFCAAISSALLSRRIRLPPRVPALGGFSLLGISLLPLYPAATVGGCFLGLPLRRGWSSFGANLLPGAGTALLCRASFGGPASSASTILK